MHLWSALVGEFGDVVSASRVNHWVNRPATCLRSTPIQFSSAWRLLLRTAATRSFEHSYLVARR